MYLDCEVHRLMLSYLLVSHTLTHIPTSSLLLRTQNFNTILLSGNQPIVLQKKNLQNNAFFLPTLLSWRIFVIVFFESTLFFNFC